MCTTHSAGKGGWGFGPKTSRGNLRIFNFVDIEHWFLILFFSDEEGEEEEEVEPKKKRRKFSKKKSKADASEGLVPRESTIAEDEELALRLLGAVWFKIFRILYNPMLFSVEIVEM